jgi:hypothetical protein
MIRVLNEPSPDLQALELNRPKTYLPKWRKSVNDNEIRAAWLWCREVWPSYRIPETETERALRLSVWRDIFGRIEPQSLKEALAHLSDREYMPSVGVIGAAARARQRDREIGAPPAALRRDPDDPLTENDKRMIARGAPPLPPGEHYMTPEAIRKGIAEMRGLLRRA